MIPHVIVLEPHLVIYKIYNGYWYFGRPTLEELRQDLRVVSRKCRPDWDITTGAAAGSVAGGPQGPVLPVREKFRTSPARAG